MTDAVLETENTGSARKGRGGGRNAKHAERSGPRAGIRAPYIVRGIPTYDIMSEESLLKIETSADRILAETGLEFRDDPEALDLWKRAGARVAGTLAKFKPGMLRELIATVLRGVSVGGRQLCRNVRP
ncbi:MAG: trimethylamine methyltransferase family protein [Gemmobacter sp.]|jgi:trimethylamine--corrinoid protein Co-methyltransferase|nr:trimethylamine methyltransferase family protein [Gemmobacter sp.]